MQLEVPQEHIDALNSFSTRADGRINEYSWKCGSEDAKRLGLIYFKETASADYLTDYAVAITEKLKQILPENGKAFEVLSRPYGTVVDGRRVSRPAIINITNTTSSSKVVNLLNRGGTIPDGVLVEISDENEDMIDLKRFLSGHCIPDFQIGLILVEVAGGDRHHGTILSLFNYQNETPKILPLKDDGWVLCDFWLSKAPKLEYQIGLGKATIKIYPSEIKRR